MVRGRAVYPRVGGETSAYTDIWGWAMRSIPAWAGKPSVLSMYADDDGVYPRVGGETMKETPMPDIVYGLSPRGRGNPRDAEAQAQNPGSIPAWAGKPAPPRRWLWCRGVYPRVGGETATAANRQTYGEGLSPRGRGNQQAMDGP